MVARNVGVSAFLEFCVKEILGYCTRGENRGKKSDFYVIEQRKKEGWKYG